MNSVPKIGILAKCLNTFVLVVPMATAIWMICNMSRQNDEGRYLMSVTAAALFFGALALMPSMLRVTSTRFYDGGIEQIALFSKGRVFSKVMLDWVSVETVIYKQSAYEMFGKGMKVRIYLGCFYDHQATANFIHGNLPADAVRK